MWSSNVLTLAQPPEAFMISASSVSPRAGLMLAFALLLSIHCGPAAAQDRAPPPEGCGAWEQMNTYGPFDYRTANAQQRALVEGAHFTQGVETLTRGKTGAYGGDIAYTIHVFPNHHRALQALGRLVQKEKADPPRGAQLNLDCYYRRAINFSPDDQVLKLLYANLLISRGQTEPALQILELVAEQAEDNPLTQNNVGLLFFDMKLFARAREQAHKAYAMGLQRFDLRERLKAVGEWREAETEVETDPPANAANSASASPP